MDYGYLAGVNYESACDGPGVRAAIFLSGCAHNCPGCHNPETHDPCFGVQITEDIIRQIAEEIKARPYLSGITLTGGDPLWDPYRTLNFLVTLKRFLGYLPNIWMYTGYTLADLKYYWDAEQSGFTEMFASYTEILVSLCDVIVDGPFIQSCADKRLAFRGSSNQHIINVKDIDFKR